MVSSTFRPLWFQYQSTRNRENKNPCHYLEVDSHQSAGSLSLYWLSYPGHVATINSLLCYLVAHACVLSPLVWAGLAVRNSIRGHLKCDGTRAETKFRLSAKRTNPFKSAGASVQSTTGSRGVRISGSNAGYIMFRGSAKSTGYPLHSPVSLSLPLPCVTVCHHISTGVYRHWCAFYFESPHSVHTSTGSDLNFCPTVNLPRDKRGRLTWNASPSIASEAIPPFPHKRLQHDSQLRTEINLQAQSL